MITLIVTCHILASLVLVLVVLLQSGKAGDLASTFGTSGSQTAFGARGAATMLTKATTFCAIIFMLTSLSLAVLYTRGSSQSVIETVDLPEVAPVESTTDLPTAELPTAEESTPEASTAPAEPPAAAESE
ncbi:MAG: preprotein translocase subunit SecG [Acidobacteriota bacterium]